MVRKKKKPLMEAYDEIVNNNKRSKHSAIRDYPPGCGRFTARIIHQTPEDDEERLVIEEKSNNGDEACSHDKRNDFQKKKKKAVTVSRRQASATRISVSAIRDYPPLCGAQ
ncbi:uncharacterized protein LOC129312697 [Prosopis cineraria]|uniref:uncharacterized protein LOC129312697 n=1 Tax=Prosopis cineraria TaxID=364024 RepID=UPI00241080D0|nr:uncharacterized protein LOC129312697 [Prosopis cineraria]XP_054811351.1 uncharacterized protein LOC129312697 [Prosopis cineraria]